MGWHGQCHSAALVASLLSGIASALPQDRPNPPDWPESVRIFGPEDSPEHIEEAVGRAFEQNGGQHPKNHGEFSSARFAFMFRPGTYKVDVPVGYYTQVLGLGKSPHEVIFDSARGIYCEESNKADLFGSLSTFWRGAENFRTRGSMLWATSQATPVRRAVIDGDLRLSEYQKGVGEGYSSGGFVGNVRVGGKLDAGSQQQYCTRNAEITGGAEGGAWNMVFVGTLGAPAAHCGRASGAPGTVAARVTPAIAEKPFISIDEAGRYSLHVPQVARSRVGPDFSWGRVIGFEQVFVARSTDSSETINRQLGMGYHVVLSPGIYQLESTLELNTDDQVLLGLGFPTLVAPGGHPAVRVGRADGVRVAGVLLEAGPGHREALLQWGDGRHAGDSRNPGHLHDVFARVGGPNDPSSIEAGAKVMVKLASGNVIGDNLWLWRADHGVSGLVKNGQNPCETGLVVTGDNVTIYGLSVEHTLGDLVQWSGNGGRTFFYQSEFPYDVTQAYGDAGFVSYRVSQTVESHHAYGLGVYHYFRDHDVTVRTGIAVPKWLENSLESPYGVFLNGRGQMLHVLNGRGPRTAREAHGAAQARWYCEQGPSFPFRPPTTTTETTTATSTTTTSMTSTTGTGTGTKTSTSSSTTSVTSTMTSTVSTSSSTTSSTVTTSTTSSSTTTSTATSTATSSVTTTTTTSSTTTSSSTTTPAMWWAVMFSGQPSVGWLAVLLPMNCCLLSAVAACYFACRQQKQQRRPDEPQVPVSRLLSLLGSPRSGHSSPSRSRLFGAGSPGGWSASPGSRHGGRLRFLSAGSPGGCSSPQRLLGSPGRSDAARTFTPEVGAAVAPASNAGSILTFLARRDQLLSSMAPNSPRRGPARLLSVSSMAESMTLSPGGSSMMPPWMTFSPARRPLEDSAA